MYGKLTCAQYQMIIVTLATVIVQTLVDLLSIHPVSSQLSSRYV
jgi:hypothetical protein